MTNIAQTWRRTLGSLAAIAGLLVSGLCAAQESSASSMPLIDVHFHLMPFMRPETLEARIAARLGHPTADPHGDPIPSADGTLPVSPCQPLTHLSLGTTGRITRVTDQHPDRLRYMADLGLVPGAIITLQARAPFDGPLTLSVGNAIHHLDIQMAQAIFIQELEMVEQMTHAQEEV